MAAQSPSPETVRPVAESFAIAGRCSALRAHERGHIHDTFVSTWETEGRERRYLHQRMNEVVFRDIPALMNNVERITSHLALSGGQVATGRGFETLELIPTHDGASWLQHESGAWRTFRFIDDTESFDLCQGEDQAWEAACAFGYFQAQLGDLDVSSLRETIPEFFSSPHRLRQLRAAVAADAVDRVAAAAPELAFVAEREALFPVMEDHLARGDFPHRVVHGDTKLNNVLFDREGRARCVVDLDTCMPGYSLYDFGDLVRFTAATSSEDETDLSRAGTDLDLYRALVAGYLEGAGRFLTEREIDLMPFSARLVTLTIGVRFLADHLAGDVYFKTAREGHNLDRARVQFRMVELMERHEREMRVRPARS